MATKDNGKVMELRAFILTTEFEKAMEDLVDNPAFNQIVKSRTDNFIRRHGRTPVEAPPCIEADPKHQQQQSTRVVLDKEQETDILPAIEAEVKPSWADERPEDSRSDKSPPPVPPTPKTLGWLRGFDNSIVPDSRQSAGAMAANRTKARPIEVTRQLEFNQDACDFWIEVKRTSGRPRIVLCSEDEGKLSLVQAIAFGSDVADIERIGNDAVVKIDRIVLDSYIRRFESNEGTVPCPTLIFSRNG